jgi:hypothetical protein
MFFSLPPRSERLWGPPSLLSNEYQELIPRGVKRPEREADHSPRSNAEVKNAWSHTFMRWYLVQNSNFTFPVNSRAFIAEGRHMDVSQVIRGGGTTVKSHWSTQWTVVSVHFVNSPLEMKSLVRHCLHFPGTYWDPSVREREREGGGGKRVVRQFSMFHGKCPRNKLKNYTLQYKTST